MSQPTVRCIRKAYYYYVLYYFKSVYRRAKNETVHTQLRCTALYGNSPSGRAPSSDRSFYISVYRYI